MLPAPGRRSADGANVNILALDTATESCNVGIWMDGSMCERAIPGRQHAEQLLQSIREIMAETGLALTQLDGIAFGRGPGMFTGLRIGAGITQGLAFALDVPVVPVSSLEALARACEGEYVLAAIDARMEQVYWCGFRRENGNLRALTPEQVSTPSALRLGAGNHWIGCGSGWDRYADALTAALGARLQSWHAGHSPRAGDIAAIAAGVLHAGGGLPPEEAVPVYVRDDVARKPGAA